MVALQTFVTPARRPVLVVDDASANRQRLAAFLSRLDVPCRFAHDGYDAVVLAQGFHYAAILMDIQMPRLDGDLAAMHIRGAHGESSETPILAVTSLPRDEAEQRCYPAGINTILERPLNLVLLATELRRYVPALRQLAEG